MSFRIAAIKILDGCEPYVRKKLKEGNVYLFSSRYIENKYNALTLEFNREVTGNFFAESMYNINRSAGVLEVSVNAIVGKNGDGKSSLLEIMLRILNNFAYARGFLEDQPTLKFVDGVNAILYYEIDSTIYSIKCQGKTVSWYKNGEEILMHEGNDKQKKRFLQENFVPIMFYTMVINYSLYAYTATSLGGGNSDDGYWIDGLFHKNDSYQTPVVLNPMRTKGVIDINKEECLSKQRLMSIFVSSDGQDEVRMVSSNEKAVGYAFSLEKESKFLKNTISKYFNDSFQDEVIWDDIKPYEYPVQKLPEVFKRCFSDFWGSFKQELAANPHLLKECKFCIANRRRNRKTDLRRYLTLINNDVYPNRAKNKRRLNEGFGREFGMMVNSKGDLSLLNYRQFYRLMLVLLVWRALTETNEFGIKGERLDDALKDSNTPRNAAKLYLIYKFISIAETYKGFCNAYYLTEDRYTPLIREWPNRDALGSIIHDLKLIMRTNDYRTLKFKQTVCYLKQGEDYYGAEPCDFPHISYDYFLSFDDLNRQMAGIPLKEIQWRLPCPVFVGDIVLYDGKNYFPLETLSSGMIQRLNTVGSLIYHLRNLDDNQEAEGMLAYDQVCIVMEEVELYYHPEYQKSYLNYLLEQISRAGLSRIKSLNLMFVTHSPFILSDITRNDILCLENGIQVDLRFQTFGANIHDLLRHPFFMKNGTIGDYAQKIINEIIVSLSVYDAKKKVGNEPFDMVRFKNENPELIKHMDFLPTGDDGSLDEHDFDILFSRCSLKEAIGLLDEPIMRDALIREYERIFS